MIDLDTKDDDSAFVENMDGIMVLPEPTTTICTWTAETDDHAEHVRDWLMSNAPFTDDSEPMCYTLANTLKGGVIVIQFDEYTMTKSDCELVGAFIRDIPCNDVTSIGAETAMTMMRVVQQHRQTLH